MKKNYKNRLYRLILSAVLLSFTLVLPFLSGQNRELGNMLCLMHIPVLLCGFFCGPLCGFAVGALAPLLRFALFGMPPLLPTGVAMCFELACYGAVSGLLYKLLPDRQWSIYASLFSAMLAGRAVWGAVRAIMYGLGGDAFGFSAFIAGAFTKSLPGIILQIVIIPVLVMSLKKYTAVEK